MKKDEVLDTAKTYVCGPREQTYGSASDNFGRIARLWSAYLSVPVSASDVACMMILLKMSRLNTTPEHMDSWIDIAGYAACGGEVSSVVEKASSTLCGPQAVCKDYNV